MQHNPSWATMSPVRKKFLKIILPIWLIATVVPLIIFSILAAKNEEKYEIYLIVSCFAILFVGLGCLAYFLPKLAKKEAQYEQMEHYGYLFRDPLPLNEEKTVCIESEFARYILTQEGVREIATDKIEKEEIFEEIEGNGLFIAWDTAGLFLATQTYKQRVHLALAIFSQEPEANGAHIILPMSEELFSAIKGFGLDDNIDDGNWTYLFYNPEDAFRQILKKGRIYEMRNKKTGKIFVDKNGYFLGDQE